MGLPPIRGVPRNLREDFEGAVQHVFSRGNRRQSIFLEDADRQLYLRMFARVSRRAGWRCLAYCLMGNHVHLLIHTPEPTLSWGMQRLHGPYAQAFNHRHAESGHVFQGRFGSVVQRTDAHLKQTAAYIALNPVEAGMAARPELYAWSSFHAVVSGEAPAWLDVEGLLGYFSANGGDPLLQYRTFVTAGT